MRKILTIRFAISNTHNATMVEDYESLEIDDDNEEADVANTDL